MLGYFHKIDILWFILYFTELKIYSEVFSSFCSFFPLGFSRSSGFFFFSYFFIVSLIITS